MIPDPLIIEEETRRRRERLWEPIPLHVPMPMPLYPEERRDRRDRQDSETGGTVIIIDINDL